MNNNILLTYFVMFAILLVGLTEVKFNAYERLNNKRFELYTETMTTMNLRLNQHSEMFVSQLKFDLGVLNIISDTDYEFEDLGFMENQQID